MVPPGLASMLAQQPAEQKDPLEDLQGAIDAMHSLMITMKDPDAVHQVATALRILTGIQQKMMSESGGSASAPPQ